MESLHKLNGTYDEYVKEYVKANMKTDIYSAKEFINEFLELQNEGALNDLVKISCQIISSNKIYTKNKIYNCLVEDIKSPPPKI